MKKQVRHSVFETNSSAVHTLSISKKGLQKCRLKVHEDGYVHISLDQEFGKDEYIYMSQKDKLKYIITWIYSYYNFDFEAIEEGYIWSEFNEQFAKYVNNNKSANCSVVCKGIKVDSCKYEDAWSYWDHQIYSGDRWDCDKCVVNLWNPEKCVEFIFNKNVGLETGCD